MITDIDDHRPHKVSVVVCLKCFMRWVSVRPESTKLIDLECETCGQGYTIETGEEI